MSRLDDEFAVCSICLLHGCLVSHFALPLCSLRLRPLNFVQCGQHHHNQHRWLPYLVTGNIIDGADRPKGYAYSIVFNVPLIETARIEGEPDGWSDVVG